MAVQVNMFCALMKTLVVSYVMRRFVATIQSGGGVGLDVKII